MKIHRRVHFKAVKEITAPTSNQNKASRKSSDEEEPVSYLKTLRVSFITFKYLRKSANN